MSLINDYLKKSRTPKADKSLSSAEVPPVMKASLGGKGEGSQKKKISPRTVVLLVLVLLVGIAGYYMSMPSTLPSSSQYQPEPVPGVELSRPAPVAEDAVPAQVRPRGQRQEQTSEKNNLQTLDSVSEAKAASPLKQKTKPQLKSLQPVPVLPETEAFGDSSGTINIDPSALKISSSAAPEGSDNESGENRAVRVRRPRRKDDLDHLFQVGALAMQAGNRSRALYYFKEVLILEPQHQEALLNLAVLYLEGKNFGAAQKLLEDAARNDSHDARVKVNQGLLALKTDDFANAQILFTDALLLDPGSTSALNNLAWLAQQRGDEVAAGIYYQNLVALDPQNLKVILAYASLCERGKDFNQAVKLYQEALASRYLEDDRSLERRIRARIQTLNQYVE